MDALFWVVIAIAVVALQQLALQERRLRAAERHAEHWRYDAKAGWAEAEACARRAAALERQAAAAPRRGPGGRFVRHKQAAA